MIKYHTDTETTLKLEASSLCEQTTQGLIQICEALPNSDFGGIALIYPDDIPNLIEDFEDQRDESLKNYRELAEKTKKIRETEKLEDCETNGDIDDLENEMIMHEDDKQSLTQALDELNQIDGICKDLLVARILLLF